MKRTLLTLLLTLLILSPIPSPASNWPFSRISRSLVHLRVDKPDGSGKGTCTGFSVDELQGLYLTAGHCASGEVQAGDVRFDVLERGVETDLALLQAPVGLPALPLSPPKEGEEYVGVGFPSGLARPFLFPMVFQGDLTLPGRGVKDSVFVGGAMSGMSGGPVVDRRGAAVSVITAGGRPGTDIQDITFGALYREMVRVVLKHR